MSLEQAITAVTNWIDKPVTTEPADHSYDLAFKAIEAWARHKPRTRAEIAEAAGRYLPAVPGRVTVYNWVRKAGIKLRPMNQA